MDLDGNAVLENEPWQAGREHRSWMLHLLAPTPEAMFFAGVHPSDAQALGPGALLVLAVPAWHGWLYASQAK